MKNLFIASIVLATVGVMSLGVVGLVVTGVLQVAPRYAPAVTDATATPVLTDDQSLGDVTAQADATSSIALPNAAPSTEKTNGSPLKNVTAAKTLTAATVATHHTKSDCWIIVSGSAYNVSDYIPYHPGGEDQIIPRCGTDATVAFNTKGGAGSSHSSDAVALLHKYLIGKIGVLQATVAPSSVNGTVAVPAPLTSSEFVIGKTVKTTAIVNVRKSTSLTGVLVGSEVLSAVGTLVAGPVQANGYTWYQVAFTTSGHTGWVVKNYLMVVTAGAPLVTPPVTTVPVVPVAPVSGALTSDIVATHNSRSNCWIVVANKVYNVTQYVPYHPGGETQILKYCGKDATSAFETKGGSGNTHSTNARTLLGNYFLGNLSSITPPNTLACTAFTYISWGSCLSSNQQSRSILTSSPSGCIGGSPVTSQSCTYTPPPVVAGGITKADVATHNSSGNCWLIISNKVYNVTQYIPFHPGGTANIVNNCGTDATTLFTTGAGHTHSANAHSLLVGYYVGDVVGVTAATCSSFTYSAWNACQVDNTQTRSLTGSSPSGCTGGSPVTSQSCTYNPNVTTCSSFTYSSWGSCQSNNTQTRTVSTSLPSGCIGGSPVTSQSCTYTPPVVTGGLTKADVATHNTSGNCWLIISNKVYNVTQYIPFHPGGTNRIVNACGTDATTLFTTNAGHTHSTSAHNLLAGYYVGDVQTTAATCSSFTYSTWNTCQVDNTQTRSVTGSSPSGCTGGNPITAQSCTYNPNTVTCTDFTYGSWGSCQSNNIQSRSVSTSLPSGCIGGSPILSQSCTYTAPTVKQTYDVSFSTAGGSLSPTSLSLKVGDSVRFTFVNAGDEQSVRFNPATISSLKLDHEFTTKTSTFKTAGTWTFTVTGQSGTITVQ